MALQKVNFESATDSYWVNLTHPELQLIAALLYQTRLGKNNIYKTAAADVMTGIEAANGSNYVDQAHTEVGVYFTLEDFDGNVAATLNSPYATIDVTGGNVNSNQLTLLP
jgi:hypothetical protein